MDEAALKKRFIDLAAQSERNYAYYFTDFLAPQDASLVYPALSEAGYPSYSAASVVTAFGGAEGCERVMLRFGDEEVLGYTEDFPIRAVLIRPKNDKFADALTHRDFLGALMHLGIERDVLGDIIVRENAACVFVKESMAPFLLGQVTQIKHTAVTAELLTEIPEEVKPRLVPEMLNVASARPDALIAKLYHLSREKAQNLFAAGCVFLNGRQLTKESAALSDGDVISVRGYGKFVFRGECSATKKGRLVVRVEKYA